ncbi:hypothetical protein KCU98_g42, partial [Aureobasidium melanogenum]
MLHHFVSASLADSTLTVLCPSSTSTILPVTSLIQSFWSSSSNLAVPAIHRSTNFPPWKIPNRSCLSSHLSIKYSMPALASLLNKAPYIVSSLLSTNSCVEPLNAKSQWQAMIAGSRPISKIRNEAKSLIAPLRRFWQRSYMGRQIPSGVASYTADSGDHSRGRSRNETLGRRRSSSCSSSKLGSADFSLFVSSIIVEIEFSD